MVAEIISLYTKSLEVIIFAIAFASPVKEIANNGAPHPSTVVFATDSPV